MADERPKPQAPPPPPPPPPPFKPDEALIGHEHRGGDRSGNDAERR